MQEAVAGCTSFLIHTQAGNLRALPQVTERIRCAFVENPPFGVKDGGFIRAGFNPELDDLRAISRNANVKPLAEMLNRT